MGKFIIAMKPTAAKPTKLSCPVCKAPLAYDGTHRLTTVPTLGRDVNVDDGGEKPK